MVLVQPGPSRGTSGARQRPVVMPRGPGFAEQKAVTLLEVTGLWAQGSGAVVSSVPVVRQGHGAGGRGKPSEAAWVWRKEGREEVAGGCGGGSPGDSGTDASTAGGHLSAFSSLVPSGPALGPARGFCGQPHVHVLPLPCACVSHRLLSAPASNTGTEAGITRGGEGQSGCEPRPLGSGPRAPNHCVLLSTGECSVFSTP